MMEQHETVPDARERAHQGGFDEACERARQLLATGTKTDVRNRYELALIAKEVHEGQAYGKATLAKFAESINTEKSSVYKWLKVANAFDEPLIARVTETPDASGQFLSWNHLVLCASVKAGAQELLVEVLERRPSVRELAKEVAARRAKKPGRPEVWKKVTKLEKQLERAAALANEVAHDTALDGLVNIVPTDMLRAICEAMEMHARTIPRALKVALEVLPRAKRTAAPVHARSKGIANTGLRTRKAARAVMSVA